MEFVVKGELLMVVSYSIIKSHAVGTYPLWCKSFILISNGWSAN